MEERKIDWNEYTKAELVDVLRRVESAVTHFVPWAFDDALRQIEKHRLDELHQTERRYAQEAHDARMAAIKLQNSGKSDLRTLEKVRRLWEKAYAADLAMLRIEKKINRMLGI